MVESYFFRRAKPDKFSVAQGIGVYLGPSETVLRCDKYVDTDNAIPPLVTRATNAAAAAMSMCSL